MVVYLLDTGILIRHLRNSAGSHALLHQLNLQGRLCISAFTRLEILRGMREHERERTSALLNSLTTHTIDAQTADRAGLLIRFYQARGFVLEEGDALIAASALQANAIFVTTNPRHFPMPELAVLGVDTQGQSQLLSPDPRV